LMIIKLYKQMTKIRVHAENTCRKILRLESNFSPTVQIWYDRIHVYLQLIRMKEGNLWFARHQHINNPEDLTLEGLRLASNLLG
jgi:hypothetical protein